MVSVTICHSVEREIRLKHTVTLFLEFREPFGPVIQVLAGINSPGRAKTLDSHPSGEFAEQSTIQIKALELV